MQMRSMRIDLRHFLYKINNVESDECHCDEGSQTPRHTLLQCPLYTDLTKTLYAKISLTDLEDTTDYDATMSHSQATRCFAEFMLQTASSTCRNRARERRNDTPGMATGHSGEVNGYYRTPNPRPPRGQPRLHLSTTNLDQLRTKEEMQPGRRGHGRMRKI
jgi:hypothetical protein